MITRKYLLILLGALVSFGVVISCSEDRTSTSYKTHPTGWMDKFSEEFHGQAAVHSGGESCGACHDIAPDALGFFPATSSATTGGACRNCHSQYPHQWGDLVQDHQSVIHLLDWNLQSCAQCHGVDLAGGQYGVSCLSCHTEAIAFTNCNLCHATPPIDNSGMPAGYRAQSFGAHAAHTRYACTECHASVPSLQFPDAIHFVGLEHVDGVPAEVDFRDAQIAGRNDYEPVYEYGEPMLIGDGGCNSVYCHGSSSVNWQGEPVSCGSCHAIPPATSVHEGVGQCHLCHPNVDPNSSYPDDIRFVAGMENTHVDGVATVTIP